MRGIDARLGQERERNTRLRHRAIFRTHGGERHGRGIAAEPDEGIAHLQMRIGFIRSIDFIGIEIRQRRFGQMFQNPDLIKRDQTHRSRRRQSERDDAAAFPQKFAIAFAQLLAQIFSSHKCGSFVTRRTGLILERAPGE